MHYTRLRRVWEEVRTSFWFVPSLMAAGAVVLGFVMTALDDRGSAPEALGMDLLLRGGADGARAVLSAIAGSMMTVGATVFSVTMVVLSLASQQYGPRLLRNFMRDTGNQLVLGTFLATFLYCLVVLRTVSGVDDDTFVPRLSVAVAVVMAVAAAAVLIYFIHHVSVSVQAAYLTEFVARQLAQQIEELYPESVGEEPEDPDREAAKLPKDFEAGAREVRFASDGYLQTVDDRVLVAVAKERDLVVRLACVPGSYFVEGEVCCRVWPAERVDDEAAGRIREAFALGPDRTPIQDPEFAITQLVQLALRALSPSLNDPFTAVTCIDRLGGALAKLARRRIPSALRLDDEGRVRVVAPPFGFGRLLRAAFDPIRHYGAEHPMVAERLAQNLDRLAALARRQADIAEIKAMRERLRRDVERENGGR